MLHWVLGILQEAVYWGTKLGTEYMDKRKKLNGGVIVNVASIAGKDNRGSQRVFLKIEDWPYLGNF